MSVQLINDDEGIFEIMAYDEESLDAAKQAIISLTDEPEVGKTYR